MKKFAKSRKKFLKRKTQTESFQTIWLGVVNKKNIQVKPVIFF